MKSPICEMVGVDFPLFAFSHCRDVVVAVSRAGGFGVLGASAFTPDQLSIELDWIDAHVDGKPYGVDLAIPTNMPIKEERGVTDRTLLARIPQGHHDFVEQLLRKHAAGDVSAGEVEEHAIGLMHDTAEALMEVSFDHPIRLIVQALGIPPQSMFDRARAKGVPVGALVGAPDHAVHQVERGVDVLVAQGNEAGAHCGEISTMVLIPEVIEAIRPIRAVPVLAAGGIVTGRQMAACMAMGAAGAWTGSVWLTTVESDVSPAVRDKLLAARSRDTVRSRSRTGKPMRQLRSAWTEAWDGPESPGPLAMPFQSLLSEPAYERANRAVAKGNEGARALVSYPVGQGVGMLDSVKSCRAVVGEFMQDFGEAVEHVATLVD